MRKLLYILVATLVATSVASCRTAKKELHHYDTLTVERAVVQEVVKHDTVAEVREVVKYVAANDSTVDGARGRGHHALHLRHRRQGT